MRSSHILRVFIIATIATVCLFVFYDTAAAQCAMCRASAGNGAFARNLNLAVVVLLAPPVSIFCAILFIAFRNRKG